MLVIVSLIVVFMLFLYLNSQYKNTNFYKNWFVDAEKFVTLNQQDLRTIDIVNLGSNQPKFAFDYSEADLCGMNWAVGPQSFEYDFMILKQYHKYLKENAVVIIPVCPFNFFAMFGHKNAFENYKYYDILDQGMIQNYSPWVKMTRKKLPVLCAGKTVAKAVFKRRDTVGNNSKLALDTNPMNDGELKQDAIEMRDRWLSSFRLDSIDDISLSDENEANIEKNITILHDMIEYCLERNYKPIIMLLPVTNELYDLLPESFRGKYITRPIQKANAGNVPVLDYSHDQRFVSHDLYINSWWFNVNGRKFFTKTVAGNCKTV
jgi:hypothetical protein